MTTADERKMNEGDIGQVRDQLACVSARKHFNFLVTRVLPHIDSLAKFDRALLMVLGPIGRWLAGRVLLVGRVGYPQSQWEVLR